MSDFVRTTEDNGGVHINSGIPNRAFALFAIDLGGNAWETAGTVWYRALTGGLSSTANLHRLRRRDRRRGIRDRRGHRRQPLDAPGRPWESSR